MLYPPDRQILFNARIVVVQMLFPADHQASAMISFDGCKNRSGHENVLAIFILHNCWHLSSSSCSKRGLSALMLLKSEKQSSYNSWTLTGTSSYLERPITETILTYAYKIPIAVMLMINQLADTHIDTWTSLWAA